MAEFPARIKIETTSETEPKLTKIAHGMVLIKDGVYAIQYIEDAKVFQQTKTIILLSQEYVSVTRTGSYNTKLEFKPGELVETYYETPYGSMQMETDTKEIRIKHDEEKDVITATVKYRLLSTGRKGEIDHKQVDILVKIMR